MDNRTNTIAGWVLAGCGAALGLSIVGGMMFHGERPEKMGYAIEGVVEEGAGGAAADVPIASLLPTADAAKGAEVFKKCAACHTINQGGGVTEDRDWQRLDKWLWSARFLKARSDCAKLIQQGLVRINRQPTDKPHARLRPGDVLTFPLPRANAALDIRVVRVLALARRRGPAPEARLLYEEIPD